MVLLVSLRRIEKDLLKCLNNDHNKKYLFKKVRFHSGKYKGLTGFCEDVEEGSNHEKAIFGIRMRLKLSNGKKGYAYKEEHFKLIEE